MWTLGAWPVEQHRLFRVEDVCLYWPQLCEQLVGKEWCHDGNPGLPYRHQMFTGQDPAKPGAGHSNADPAVQLAVCQLV
jgi:hypothetical protein